MDCVARPACCWVIVARHFARHSCAPLLRAPLPFRVPLPPVVPFRCAPWPSPVAGGLVARQGWGGGGAPDAGSGPSLREFPHGGADACSPRQGVTLLYGPSICTRLVQMDLRRNQVRRRFPTPGSGTLWVSGESLRDRHVSCLPRWGCALPAAPHRTRTAVRAVGSALGQAHWPAPQAGATSGRWPTVPGVTHLIACAQVGPIRTPGGPPNPRGRVPHQRLSRALVTPGPPRSLRCWSVPPCFRPQGRPPVPRPLPCPLAPAMSRLPLLSAPALACGCPLLFVFFFGPLPPPTSPRYLLAVLSLFVGGWRSRGRGGGVLAVRPIAQARRKHGAGTRRGTCPSAGGGGLAVWLPPSPYPSCGCTPGGPPVGACTARASFGHGRVVRPALWFLCLPTLPRRPRGGGSASHYRHPPCPLAFPSLPSPLSLVGVGVGGGEGGAPSLPFLRRKHVAGTALAHGAALVLLLGSGARRVAPVFALPTLRSLPRCPPRRGLHGACFPWARSCGPSRTLTPPPPLLAALPSGGGAAVRPSLPASPTLGGAEARGGGGACRFSFVALMSQARGAASVSLQGGGGYAS